MERTNRYADLRRHLLRRSQAAAVLLLMLMPSVALSGRRTIVVAQDGSGQYRTIQQALDAVREPGETIVVKRGIYPEKIFIRCSGVALVGEDRDSTRIEYAELRSAWNAAHAGSDWGAAVVNIDSTATDITVANLTIHNTYGSFTGNHDHQFAIRGGGTRTILLNCSVISDGGDAVSLWNRRDGMYYHALCRFEGWVDYVCPRGWCFITDCSFFGHNLSASIWHDGSAAKDQKLVIRNSFFDGVPGFPFGRHHRDAQFVLVDCTFSRAMADRPIYRPDSPNTVPWVWGDRQYYFHCHRDGGDYAWFQDDLDQAEGHPSPSDITSRWTFGGRWDPEASMPAVLPVVALPSPRDGDSAVATAGTTLRWLPSRRAERSVVRFGEDARRQPDQNVNGRSASLPELKPGTRYAWQILEIAGTDTIAGPAWHFTTAGASERTAVH